MTYPAWVEESPNPPFERHLYDLYDHTVRGNVMRQQQITRKAPRRRVTEWETAADAERHDREVRARRQARKATMRAERVLAILAECELDTA